jgi:hypothetical protein
MNEKHHLLRSRHHNIKAMLMGSDEPSGLPASSAGYTRAVLMIYDLWVTHFSNRYVWRCSVEIHRDHYRKWIGKRHLEVGVGTGYYLSGATLFNREEVGTRALPPRSFFGGGIVHRLLLRVSPVKSTSAPVRF